MEPPGVEHEKDSGMEPPGVDHKTKRKFEKDSGMEPPERSMYLFMRRVV